MSLVLMTDSLHAYGAAEAARAMGQAVTVDFDATVLGQIALFIILLLILKPTLFDPMLKLFEEREKRILGAKLQARKLDEGSAGALTKYESEMQHARTAGITERDKLRAEGVKTENEILAKVRASTADTIDAGRRRMAVDAVTVRASLRGEAGALAKELAARVLGRQVL
jgi:F-type H+-transporting ATPase subunit b